MIVRHVKTFHRDVEPRAIEHFASEAASSPLQTSPPTSAQGIPTTSSDLSDASGARLLIEGGNATADDEVGEEDEQPDAQMVDPELATTSLPQDHALPFNGWTLVDPFQCLNSEGPLAFDYLGDWVFPLSTALETRTSDDTDGTTAVSTDYRTAADDAEEVLLAGDGALTVSTDSIGMFEASLRALDVEQRIIGLRLPSKFRAMRYIRAYFDYFSPHTPILPMQTFSMSTAHRKC